MDPRTPARKKAKEIAKYFRGERPDYFYMKDVFKYLREELEIEVEKAPKKLPYVPTEEQLKQFYHEVWESKNFQDMMIIKTFLYTGCRVNELVNIRLSEVDLNQCQIRITDGKGSKDRVVPFPKSFKELIAMHMDNANKKGAVYLFESSWKKKYTPRGIRKIIERYSDRAGLERSLSPHMFRHFILSWLKRQGIDDALIQPYSGHESRKSLEVYSKIAITDAQNTYDGIISRYPI